MRGPIVIALGGNAISPADEVDSIADQFVRTTETARHLVRLHQAGWERQVITHGNGPQVGNAVTRVELGRDVTPWLPLFICVADTQGGMGYMIQQCLLNEFRDAGIERSIATVVTQVLVDESDPAFDNPAKPIGPRKHLVASPTPLQVMEAGVISSLVSSGVMVIAGGGGGVPVIARDGRLEGAEAVVDKDLTAGLIARAIEASHLVVLTDVDGVYTDWGSAEQKRIEEVGAVELRRLIEAGRFPAGSMGPKVEAACAFVEAGGELAVIAGLDEIEAAVEGKAGTRVRRE